MNLLIVCVSFLAFGQLCSATNVIGALKNALLDGYEKDAKPDGKVTVKAGATITDFDLCAHKEALTTTGWVTMMWTDNRLSWDPEKFNKMDRIRVPSSQVWIPDITFYNMIGPMTPLAETNAIIFANGMVIYVPPVSVQTHCNVNYANWPFGEQNCTFTAGSWTNDLEQLDIQPYLGWNEADSHENPLEFDWLLSKKKYEITGNQHERHEKEYPCCPGEKYPSLKMAFQFKQKHKFMNGQLNTP